MARINVRHGSDFLLFPCPPFVRQEAIGVEYDPRGTPSPRGPTRPLLVLPLPIPGVTHFSVPASYPCPCHEFVSGIPLGKFQSDEGPRDRGLEIIPRDLDSRPCEFRPSLRGTHRSVPKLVHWTLGRLAVETLDPYFHLGLAMAPWTFHLPSPRKPSFLSAWVSPPQVPPGRHQCLLYLSSNPSPTETWQIRQPQPHILSQDARTCRYATPIAPDPRNAGFISSCKSTLVLKISRSTDSQGIHSSSRLVRPTETCCRQRRHGRNHLTQQREQDLSSSL